MADTSNKGGFMPRRFEMGTAPSSYSLRLLRRRRPSLLALEKIWEEAQRRQDGLLPSDADTVRAHIDELLKRR